MNIITAIKYNGHIFNIGDKIIISNADYNREAFNGLVMEITKRKECNYGCRINSKCVNTSEKYLYYASPIGKDKDIFGGIHSCYCEMRRYKEQER